MQKADSHPAQNRQVDAARPAGGLTFVDYHCPQCGAVSAAPVAKMSAGQQGIWCCERCENAFYVRVDMEMIDVPHQPNTTETSPLQRVMSRVDDDDHAPRQQRLLSLYGEQLLLQSRLQELVEEVARLKASLCLDR